LSDERLEIFLVEIERKCENNCPDDNLAYKTKHLTAPDIAEYLVIVLSESVYLFQLSLNLWVHVFLVYHLVCPLPESNKHITIRTGLFYPLN